VAGKKALVWEKVVEKAVERVVDIDLVVLVVQTRSETVRLIYATTTVSNCP